MQYLHAAIQVLRDPLGKHGAEFMFALTELPSVVVHKRPDVGQLHHHRGAVLQHRCGGERRHCT